MYNIINSFSQGQTPGTLSTTSMYTNPQIPRNSQAAGISGTDNRGYTRTVGPDELVENRLNNLTNDPNNQYLSQARGEAQRQAASRGLGNSSIAAGAGVRAAIQSALPIASQDASTFAQAQGQNLDAMNANLMQERDIQNRMLEAAQNREMTASQNDQNRADAAAARELSLRMQRENLAYEGEQAGLNRGHDLERLGTDYSLRDLFANNQLGRDIATMGADTEFRTRFAEGQMGRDITTMGADTQFRDFLADNDALRQDWLSGNEYNRQFYGDMMGAFMGVTLGSASEFFSGLNDYAMNNPDVFNAEDYTNFSQFVNTNMSSVFNNIFANFFGQQGGGGG